MKIIASGKGKLSGKRRKEFEANGKKTYCYAEPGCRCGHGCAPKKECPESMRWHVEEA